MFDLIVRAGTVVDGTGSPPVTADIGVTDGRIVELGRLSGSSRQEIDADGLVVTPGFVDIHTHFDGQATWDPLLAPSSSHGVTSVAMGNCGVGFAPARPDRHDWLIGMMEGVEDIPGTALAEGLAWDWETFPEYLDALDATPRTLDIGAHVPHAALRTFVMGERGADPLESPDDRELLAMTELLAEGVAVGAVGMGTSRTEVHRTRDGDPLGTLLASERELVALAGALRGSGAVLQMVSDCYQATNPDIVASELALMEAMARASTGRLSFSLQQVQALPDRWRELQRWASDCAQRGLDIWAQVAPRPVGVLLGLSATIHPFVRCPSYAALSSFELPARVAALGEPARRSRILEEHRSFAASLPTTGNARQLFASFDLMFQLEDPVDYDMVAEQSLGACARAAGSDAAGAVYDTLLEDGGRRLLYSPLFNFAGGDLGDVREMIDADRSLFGLSDAGAHCGAICDASFTTSYLSLWARDRIDHSPIEEIVPRITRDTARHIGWHDRGVLAPGMVADINVVDLNQLGCAPPRIVHDLPSGGRRLVQAAYGYRHTIKSGVPTFADGEHTGALPGRLLRGPAGATH